MMKSRLITTLATVLIGSLTSAAQASMITETWNAIVLDNQTALSYAVNDTFSWTISYDNTSTSMNIFGDGLDNMARTSDDFLQATLSSHPLISFFADTLQDSSTNILAAMRTARMNADPLALDSDQFSSNRQNRYKTINNDEILYQQADHFTAASIFSYAHSVPASTFSYFYTTKVNDLTTNKVDTLSFGVTSVTVANIPEPSSMAIFALGMVGLGFRKKFI